MWEEQQTEKPGEGPLNGGSSQKPDERDKLSPTKKRTALPDEKTLAAEIRRTQEILRKREAFLLPQREEIRVKRIAGRKKSAKTVRGKRK
jgi:hypothetical protein